MGRALAAPAVVAALLLLTGCASVPEADAQACDYLFSKQDKSLDEDEEALQAIVADMGPVAAGDTLSTELRPYVEKVVSDARRLLRGRDVDYLDLHVLDALSVCMDEGW